MVRRFRALTVAAALVAVLSVSGAGADQPIASVDDWDEAFAACLAAPTADCLDSPLSDHLPTTDRGNLSDAMNAIETFLGLFSGHGVYGVHDLIAETYGDFIVRRLWVVEGNDGNFVSVYVILIRSKGAWYVKKFDFSTKEEDLESYLSFEI